MMYPCPANCGASYSRQDSAIRHFCSVHSNSKFTCDKCSRSFNWRENLTRHLKICRGLSSVSTTNQKSSKLPMEELVSITEALRGNSLTKTQPTPPPSSLLPLIKPTLAGTQYREYSALDFMFKHPFTAIVAGPTGCGKSHFVKSVIANLSKMCDVDFKNIFWYTPTETDNGVDSRRVQYRVGLPDMDEFDPRDGANLIVVDDMMRETNGSVVDLFTKGSHHKNLSVFFITQNLFHQGRGQRDISLNAHYIVYFKNPRDRAQINHLARQIYPENSKFLMEAYTDATKDPHGYLLMDLKQSTPDSIRVRTCVIPGGCYPIVYDPIKKRRR